MKKNFKKHYLDVSKIAKEFTVLDIKEWVDYNTKQPKGVTFQVFFSDEEESYLIPIKVLGKTLEECEKYKNNNIQFKNMFVVPWVKNGSTFVNYSYQADDIVGV